MSRTSTVRCPCCEGYARVAIIRLTSNDPFARALPELCNRPMSVTFARARSLMMRYGAMAPDRARAIVVKRLAQNLDTAPCPHCHATGVAFTLTFGDPV